MIPFMQSKTQQEAPHLLNQGSTKGIVTVGVFNAKTTIQQKMWIYSKGCVSYIPRRQILKRQVTGQHEAHLA